MQWKEITPGVMVETRTLRQVLVQLGRFVPKSSVRPWESFVVIESRKAGEILAISGGGQGRIWAEFEIKAKVAEELTMAVNLAQLRRVVDACKSPWFGFYDLGEDRLGVGSIFSFVEIQRSGYVDLLKMPEASEVGTHHWFEIEGGPFAYLVKVAREFVSKRREDLDWIKSLRIHKTGPISGVMIGVDGIKGISHGFPVVWGKEVPDDFETAFLLSDMRAIDYASRGAKSLRFWYGFRLGEDLGYGVSAECPKWTMSVYAKTTDDHWPKRARFLFDMIPSSKTGRVKIRREALLRAVNQALAVGKIGYLAISDRQSQVLICTHTGLNNSRGDGLGIPWRSSSWVVAQTKGAKEIKIGINLLDLSRVLKVLPGDEIQIMYEISKRGGPERQIKISCLDIPTVAIIMPVLIGQHDEDLIPKIVYRPKSRA